APRPRARRRARERRPGRDACALRRARGGAPRPLRPRRGRAAAGRRLTLPQGGGARRGGADSRRERAGEPPVLREARLEAVGVCLLVEGPVRAAILVTVDRVEEVVVARAAVQRLLGQLRAVARLPEVPVEEPRRD